MRKGLARSACLVVVVASVGMGLGASIASAQDYGRLSCGQLWYERNAIFAAFGYCFQSQQAIATFGQACYSPYGRLSPRAQARVNEIKAWERRKGCTGG